MVFIDDNPFERNLVRSTLATVLVPEVPNDPALFIQCVADAGYFESLAITDEDRERTKLYQANTAREALQAQSSDLPSYLRGLRMELIWRHFDQIGLQRTVQLINKTNQFNLTTRRVTDEEIARRGGGNQREIDEIPSSVKEVVRENDNGQPCEPKPGNQPVREKNSD